MGIADCGVRRAEGVGWTADGGGAVGRRVEFGVGNGEGRARRVGWLRGARAEASRYLERYLEGGVFWARFSDSG